MSSTDPARRGARTPCSLLARTFVLGAACAALGLAGCATSPTDAPGAKLAGKVVDPITPLDQYAVTVGRSPDAVAMSVHASGLSPTQRAALEAFAARWRETGGSETVTVQSPVNSAEPGNARAAAVAVTAVLVALGVPPARLQLTSYDAGGQPGAPLYVRYERYEATGPDCRKGWDNLTSTLKNVASTHFGCAGTANLAAMVADPHDLERPSLTAPADSVRRAIVLDKYRQGVVTSSQKDPQAEGVVSSAVN